MVVPGNLLLSEPFMMDPTFQRSVVLVCEHDEVEGSFGYLLNRPTDLMLSEVLEEDLSTDFPVFVGGPVGLDTLHYIHTKGNLIPESQQINEQLFWGGDLEVIVNMLVDGSLNLNSIKFFIGYSGWEPNQLKEEMDLRSWITCKSYHPDIPFLMEAEDLWKEVLVAMGPKFAHVANFPIDPRLN